MLCRHRYRVDEYSVYDIDDLQNKSFFIMECNKCGYLKMIPMRKVLSKVRRKIDKIKQRNYIEDGQRELPLEQLTTILVDSLRKKYRITEEVHINIPNSTSLDSIRRFER